MQSMTDWLSGYSASFVKCGSFHERETAFHSISVVVARSCVDRGVLFHVNLICVKCEFAAHSAAWFKIWKTVGKDASSVAFTSKSIHWFRKPTAVVSARNPIVLRRRMSNLFPINLSMSQAILILFTHMFQLPYLFLMIKSIFQSKDVLWLEVHVVTFIETIYHE